MLIINSNLYETNYASINKYEAVISVKTDDFMALFRDAKEVTSFEADGEIYDGFVFDYMNISDNEILLFMKQQFDDTEALTILTGTRPTLKEAEAIREEIETLATFADDETAESHAWAFPEWFSGKDYAVGDRVRYGELLYKCVQEHTSQMDWTPDAAVSLWSRTSDPAEEWPEWIQPTGAHDAYQTGDKVSHNEKHWISTADANVWEPGAYGWDEE